MEAEAQPLFKGAVEVANGDRRWRRVFAGVHTQTVISDCVDVKECVSLWQPEI
jgi:hypothetical protein